MIIWVPPHGSWKWIQLLRAVGSCLGTLGTFLFLGTFPCLVGDVRESSWLMFSLPFLLCLISLSQSSLDLKVGFSWRRKCPSLSLRLLRNTVAFTRQPFCCGQVIVEPAGLSSSSPLMCIWEISTLLSHRPGKVWRPVCIWPCGNMLGGSAHLAPLSLLSCVHWAHWIMYIQEDSIKDSLPLTRAAPSWQDSRQSQVVISFLWAECKLTSHPHSHPVTPAQLCIFTKSFCSQQLWKCYGPGGIWTLKFWQDSTCIEFRLFRLGMNMIFQWELHNVMNVRAVKVMPLKLLLEGSKTQPTLSPVFLSSLAKGLGETHLLILYCGYKYICMRWKKYITRCQMLIFFMVAGSRLYKWDLFSFYEDVLV